MLGVGAAYEHGLVAMRGITNVGVGGGFDRESCVEEGCVEECRVEEGCVEEGCAEEGRVGEGCAEEGCAVDKTGIMFRVRGFGVETMD